MFNIFQRIDQISSLINQNKIIGKKISLVPTMGSLHEGHFKLIEEAKLHSDFVIVSIFVNKKQFNQKEDYNKYPRNLDKDIAMLKQKGVNAIFCPDDVEIYPKDNIISINIKDVDRILCGKDRIGHFNGVLLIIIKLFSIIRPDIALFGLKDFQQFFLIKRLVQEFNINTKIIGIETIREKSGLALSSRNLRLSNNAIEITSNIFYILSDIRKKIINNNKINIDHLLNISKKYLIELGFQKILYLEIRDEENLNLCIKYNPNVKYRIFISAIIEDVRLIDNYPIGEWY